MVQQQSREIIQGRSFKGDNSREIICAGWGISFVI